MKTSSKRSKARRDTILWIVGFSVLFVFVLGWPFYALFSTETSTSVRVLAVVSLLIAAAVVILSVLSEARRKRAIRSACASEGFSRIDIQTRKTHYLVSFEGPSGHEVRKCRVSLRQVEWLT